MPISIRRSSRAGKVTLRLDIVNLFDHKYELRDGSGIGVGAPQFGPRRTILAGVSKSFGERRHPGLTTSPARRGAERVLADQGNRVKES